MRLTDKLLEEGNSKLEAYAKNCGVDPNSRGFDFLVVRRSSFLMWYEKMQQQKYDVSRFAHYYAMAKSYRRIK